MAKAITVETLANHDAHKIFYEYTLRRSYPSLSDGMHEVYRAIMYSFYNDLKPKNGVKSTELSSHVNNNYHLHKSDSIYRSTLMMSGERLPLVTSSNEGTAHFLRDGVPTEKYIDFFPTYWGEYLHSSILNASLKSNYALTKKMPMYYPTMLPYLLFTNYTNINVGITTYTMSFNPNEIFGMMLKLIRNSNVPTEELMEGFKGPDIGKNYSIVCHPQSLYTMIETGYGKFDILTNFKFTRDRILFRDVPYRSTKLKFLKYISNLKFESMMVGVPELSSSPDCVVQLPYTLVDGYSLKDAQEELYKKTTLKKTIPVELVGFHPEDKPEYANCENPADKQRRLDIIGIREYLLTCLHYGYIHRLKDLELQIEDIYKQVEMNSLLEKLTRPEILAWLKPIQDDSNKKNILYTRGNKEILEQKIGRHITIKGGITMSEVETTFQRTKNDILGRLDERNNIMRELLQLDDMLEELFRLKEPYNIILYLEEVIKEWMQRPECVRQSEVLFTSVDEAITTKCEISEQMLIKHMISTGEKVNVPVNVIFYTDGTADYWNANHGEDIPPEMVSKEISTIIKCKTNDTILIFNSARRFKVKVKSFVRSLEEYNKLALAPGLEFYGALPYEWNVEPPTPGDIALIVTTHGRLKKAPMTALMQKFEHVKPMPLYPTEKIKAIYVIPESSLTTHTLEIITNVGIKRRKLQDVMCKGLKGFVSLVQFDCDKPIRDFRICHDEPQLTVKDGNVLKDIDVDITQAHKRDIYKEFVVEAEGKYDHYIFDKQYYTSDGKITTPQEVFSIDSADITKGILTSLPNGYVTAFVQSSKSRMEE